MDPNDPTRLAAALSKLPKATLQDLSRLLDQVVAADALPGLPVGDEVALPLYNPESAETFGLTPNDWEHLPDEIAATWGVG